MSAAGAVIEGEQSVAYLFEKPCWPSSRYAPALFSRLERAATTPLFARLPLASPPFEIALLRLIRAGSPPLHAGDPAA